MAIAINMWKTYITLSLFAFGIIGNVSSLRKRACVIGAGPSGLVSTRFLAANLNDFEPIVFEKNSDVGGLWIYTDSTTVDKHGLPVHSSMYRDLRINGPKQLLKYPDFDDIEGETSFVGHADILKYLRKYADRFNLRKHIQFDTNVEKLSLLPNDKWLLTSKNLNTQKASNISCDAVLLANGHFVKEQMPEIPGMKNFPGQVIHSHLYRKPEDFTDKTVVILGAAYSGVDIAIQISSKAKKVYLSSKYPRLRATLPSNLEQVDRVVEAIGSGLRLRDNRVINADAFVFCTGYLYDFPFLDANSGIVVQIGKYVKPLYKHVINIEHPTMAILNIPHPGFPLIMPYAQVPFFLAVLQGKVKLPSYNDMWRMSALPAFTSKCVAHYIPDVSQIISYYNELATLGGGQPLPLYFKAAIEAYVPYMLTDPINYRNKNLYIYANNTVKFA